MHSHPSHLVLTTLAATVLAACDVPDAALPAPTPRALVDGPLADTCLTDTKLILHHEDGTDDVTPDLATGLGELARPGDLLELAFSVTPQCASQHSPRITLASATARGDQPMSLVPAPPTPAFDIHAARLDGGPQLLHVRLPRCSYTLDLAFGEPLPVQSSPRQTYAAQSRLILSSEHAGATCDEAPLAVERFDPIEPGWGDAPVSAHFGWQLAADPDAELRCELDLDADGQADEILKPCMRSTEGIKTAALPLHKYAVGKHRPELVVSDGSRRIWAATDIYANHVDFKPGVRFLEQLPGYLSAALVPAEPPAPVTLTLTFASAAAVPTVKNGEVIVGHGGGSGYMLRVELATRQGDTLVVSGHSVDLDQVVDGGFLGYRDLRLGTAGATCISAPCPDEIIPLVTPADKTPDLEFGLETLGDVTPPDGSRLVYKIGQYGEMRVASDFELERFELDLGFLSIDHAYIRMTPTFDVSLSLLPATIKFPLGKMFLAALPAPIPVTFMLEPELEFQAGTKFTAQMIAAITGTAYNGAGGWETSVEPHVESVLDLLGANISMSLKALVKLRVEANLALLTGPHVAVFGGPGWRRSLHASCERCDTFFLESGGEIGWGNLFTPIKLLFPEKILEQDCYQEAPYCEPEDNPPPGGGGSGGDVHLLSHDGLMFDFQAGGEFVLTRALTGAPFEVQARQEPVGDFRSLSFNTAIATRVGDHRVGFYAREPGFLRVDGVATQLQPGASLDLGDGVLTRHDSGRYSITYTGGEILRLRRVGATLNARLKLPPARAGAVVGLLGDADGSIVDDIAVSADTHLSQPVSEQMLYRGDDSFTAAWRLDPAASLFDYAPGTSAATYRTPHYLDMPADSPPFQLPHAGLANDLCVACPGPLRDACMLDVGVTGDAELAGACLETDVPVAIMYPADGPTIVSPRNGSPLDCTGIAAPFRFRAPGAADSGPGFGPGFTITVRAHDSVENDWYTMSVPTTSPLGEYGFECTPIGAQGWGECVFTAADPLCSLLDGPRWSQHTWSVTADVPPQVGAATSVASFTVP